MESFLFTILSSSSLEYFILSQHSTHQENEQRNYKVLKIYEQIRNTQRYRNLEAKGEITIFENSFLSHLVCSLVYINIPVRKDLLKCKDENFVSNRSLMV